MGLQVVDTVAVVAGVILFQLVNGAKTVLYDEHRLLVALIHDIQGIPEAYRIDLPTPVGCLYIRILDGVRCRASYGLDFRYNTALNRVRHIVAEANVVYNAFSQDFLILRLHVRGVAFPLPCLFGIGSVMTAAVDVHEVEFSVHRLIGQHDIIRIAGVGIYGNKGAHTANLEIGIDLMTLFDDQRGSYQLMVGCLIKRFFGILEL